MKEGDDDLPQRVHFFDSRARNTLNQLYIPYAIDLAYCARGIIMPSNSNRETQAQRVDTMRHAFK